MRGIINIIEEILETPEMWGTLSLTHEELENMRKYVHDLTADISDEQAKFLLRQIDLLDAAPQLLAECQILLLRIKNEIGKEWGIILGGETINEIDELLDKLGEV